MASILGLAIRAAAAVAKVVRNPAVRKAVVEGAKRVGKKIADAGRWVIQKCSRNKGGPLSPAKIQKVKVRTTRAGDKAVNVTRKDGSKIDISPKRVKEFVPNTHPKAPPGSVNPVKFPNAQPGTKGLKRNPTREELEFLRNSK